MVDRWAAHDHAAAGRHDAVAAALRDALGDAQRGAVEEALSGKSQVVVPACRDMSTQ